MGIDVAKSPPAPGRVTAAEPRHERRITTSSDVRPALVIFDVQRNRGHIVPSRDVPTPPAQVQFRALAEKLTEVHPAISTEESIFGGMPHIKGVRLSVGDILAKLYVYGNIEEILDTYSPHVSEEQVKEAIAYAQDFLEMACDPDQTSEVDD